MKLRPFWLCWLYGCCLAAGASAQEAAAQTQPSDLFAELSQAGILLANNTSVPLPAPGLVPGQSSAERQQQLLDLAGKLGWERFARKSVFAPVMIDLEYIQDAAGTRIGHNIHTAFVAYAPLATLRDEQLMQNLFGVAAAESPDANSPATAEDQSSAAAAFQAAQIPSEELQRLGIATSDSTAERYSYIELPLLNEVTLRGTLRIAKREGPNWVELMWHLDPRFAESPRFSNTWTKIERNEVGMKFETEPVPYAGCGGFVSVTEIDEEQHQLLIESRMILHEPAEWFAGSNFLRSKLPIALQENARNFRRRLAK